ncbi:MAG: hypothetical protein J6D16_02340 [Clostridia bacterium]|nr:hypothetical protein [Clostridia bacterium]MBO5306195.1 hypothetical protein [Clostridia bacterium]
MERENLFRVDLDSEKDDVVIDREEFILRRESAAVAAEREALNEKWRKSLLKSVIGVHSVMNIFFVLFLLGGLLCGLMTLIEYLESKVLSEALLATTILFLALSVVFLVLKVVFGKKEGKNDSPDAIDDELGRLNEISKRELRVPRDARKVELFWQFYEKNSTFDEPYDLDEVEIFEENGKLCLYYIDAVIGVPIDRIEAVVKLGDTITFSDWMKDEEYDSAPYVQYGITKRQVGEHEEEYSMNGYYSIRFREEGTPFEILVPPYEIKPFLDILKMEVTKE